MKDKIQEQIDALKRQQETLTRRLLSLQQEYDTTDDDAPEIVYVPPALVSTPAPPVHRQETDKPIYTFDIETDPFEYDRVPQPFACGLYSGGEYFDAWGDDCIEQMHVHLQTIPPGIIYAHNGGRFDGWYTYDWIANECQLTVINNRIVKAKLWRADNGYHELRDSFALMPFALKKYKKDVIDVRTFERATREKNKSKIRSYLRGDCVYLWELCTAYWKRFGDRLTVGGTAMAEIKALHDFDTLTEQQDARLRARFYFGGRVQCFEKGIVKPNKGKSINVYDINQAYPYVMKHLNHPIGVPDDAITNEISKRTAFLTVYGRSYGAFPRRTDDGLQFADETGVFNVTRHEYDAAIETGMFELFDVIETVNFDRFGNFAAFVDKFHKLRRDAQLVGDETGSLQYKYVGNSGYGKFAQDPANYYNYQITDQSTNLNPECDPDGWQPSAIMGMSGHIMWQQKSFCDNRYNVATGASITGGTRSLLIRAIAKAKRPIYCDTDSLFCETLKGVPIDDTKIGHWKLEKSGNKMAIGGRKVYALFARGKCVKSASKGSHISPDEIVRVANGEEIDWFNPAPTFNMKTRGVSFIKRTVRLT